MRAFSGIKPSGELHLGSYFGAIRQWVEFQKNGEMICCIVDYHAITVPQKPDELRARTRMLIATYLAAGIDPIKNMIFIQSHVQGHTELGWIFNCLIRMSELERMTQYKDKAIVKGENVSVGFFDYPALMAADILLYDTDIVPVGHDQVQHVELACDVANRFNKTYGETFKIPKAVIQKVGARVMSLDNPTEKMSKEHKNTVMLMDEADVIRKKVSRAMTDSLGTITYSKDRPGISNLIEIFHHATGREIPEIVASYAGKGYKEFKADLAEALITMLAPIQTKTKDYLDHPAKLDEILRDGAHRASVMAKAKLALIKDKVGFLA
ncbi:MAG: tryptophan--tRNA ligase [bacterium]